MDDEAIVNAINASGASILFTAFGNPKQELWFDRNQSRLRVGVTVGIGGTFSFIDGSVRRAPAWIQRSGFEWAYRIAQEPGRLWRRYACGGLKFAALAIGFLLSQIRRRSEKRDLWDRGELLLPGADSLTHITVCGNGWTRLTEIDPRGHRHILLDAAACTSLRGSQASYLLAFIRACKGNGVKLHMRVAAKLRQTIAREYYFQEVSPILVSDLPTYLSQCHGTHVAVEISSEARIIGEFDAAAVQWISDAGLLRGADRLDLGDCSFIDSTAMGWLVGQKRICNSGGKDLELTALSPPFRRSLRLANLETYFVSDDGNVPASGPLHVLNQAA
jgi:anti-anti-sigma factor